MGSLGFAEGMHTQIEGQARTLLHRLRSRYPNVRIELKDHIVERLVRHATFLIGKFQKGSDGFTPHRRLTGKDYLSEMLEFGGTSQL